MNEPDYNILLNIGTFVVTFSASWGAMKANSKSSEDRIKSAEERISHIIDNYVSRESFNQIVHMLRTDTQELRMDVKRILELLSGRG